MNLSAPDPETVHVLHVDDDHKQLTLAENWLDKLRDNFVIHGETDPDRVLERLSNESIDCLISDYRMPQQNGVELLRDVREAYPNLPFILFTGEGSETVASEATTAGVTAYVEKGGSDVYQLLANQVDQSVAHRRSERRARIANERLLELYEQTDGFYILDDDWTVLYWNHEMATRTNRDPETVQERSLWEVFPEATETELYDRLHAAKERGESVQFETYYRPHDYWTEIRAYPADEGLIVHSREITTEKERAAELERRNQILESFANTVSHDFRNPLSVAQGHLELAQETGDFTHLDEVAMAHNRMRNLIDDLLELARGDDFETAVVSLEERATDAWTTVPAEETTLVVREDLQFEAYQSQLRRFFENLYWNALDHGNASEIRVGVHSADGFYVEDDGDGISTDTPEEIFEIGYSTSDDGTGYGLHIVESLADMHDWRISVTENDDGGARFEVDDVTLAVG